MKVYMAGSGSLTLLKCLNYDKDKCPYFLLQTFYDLRRMKEEKIRNIISSCHEFLLDSGAFTFMHTGIRTNWKQYVNEYIDFINKYDIEHFFELDLYSLPDVGIEKTIKIRRYIEHYTGKKCIPVFHKCMGMEMYRKLCEEYDYIAIGASGKNDSKWTKNKKVLKQLLKIAKQYGTRVHGLGYTRLVNINRTEIPFYSVDSSSYLGSRFNTLYVFKNNMLTTRNAVTENNQRLKDSRQLDLVNLREWRKLQLYKMNETL